MAKSFEDRIASAKSALENGFDCEAARKRALENVQWAYDILRDHIYDAPFSLAHVREKHMGLFSDADKVRSAVELRDQIKNAVIIKKQTRKQIEESKVAKLTSSPDELTKTFQKITDDMRGPFHDAVKDRIIRTARFLVGSIVGQQTKVIYDRKNPLMFHQMIVRNVFDATNNIRDNIFTGLNENRLERYAEKEAAHETRMMFDGFVRKNVLKMEGILKGLKVEKIDLSLTPMSLEGEMNVSLEKNAAFRMTFQIEHATSKLGKDFYRFPTRFHDVKKTDGSKLKNASETKMKKEFA